MTCSSITRGWCVLNDGIPTERGNFPKQLPECNSRFSCKVPAFSLAHWLRDAMKWMYSNLNHNMVIFTTQSYCYEYFTLSSSALAVQWMRSPKRYCVLNMFLSSIMAVQFQTRVVLRMRRDMRPLGASRLRQESTAIYPRGYRSSVVAFLNLTPPSWG